METTKKTRDLSGDREWRVPSVKTGRIRRTPSALEKAMRL